MISLTSPVKTRAHGWPAGGKLLALCLASVALFAARDVWMHLLAALGVLGLYALPGRVFFIYGMRRLWPLWPFAAVILLWHVFTDATQDGVLICFRMLSAVGLANLVTMTTSLAGMMATLRRVLRPFGWLGVNLRAIELAMAMVIRFTPVLALKGAALTMAWRARSRRRAGWRVIVPFMVLAIDDADHVAEALRARGGFDMDRTT
jgi:biotin transport system permease protein